MLRCLFVSFHGSVEFGADKTLWDISCPHLNPPSYKSDSFISEEAKPLCYASLGNELLYVDMYFKENATFQPSVVYDKISCVIDQSYRLPEREDTLDRRTV